MLTALLMMVMKMMVKARDEERIVEVFESSPFPDSSKTFQGFFFLFFHCENYVIYESSAIFAYVFISNIPAGGILTLLRGRILLEKMQKT